MEPEIQQRIEETVLEILRGSNMDETTEYKVRKAASDRLGLDLSKPDRKRFVRDVVEAYLADQQSKEEEEQRQQNDAVKQADADEEEQEEEEEDDEDEQRKRKRGSVKQYNDDGDLVICELSTKRKVTLQEFRGKTLVSMREYYSKGGKELPTSKGISLTVDQWSVFKNNVPAIEKAIKKMESRVN